MHVQTIGQKRYKNVRLNPTLQLVKDRPQAQAQIIFEIFKRGFDLRQSGDDLVLARGDLTGGDLGYFIGSANFSLGANNLGVGDAVQLYWFPTLTLSSTTADESTPYGSYRSATGLDGSAPWVVPNDGTSTLDLKFLYQR